MKKAEFFQHCGAAPSSISVTTAGAPTVTSATRMYAAVLSGSAAPGLNFDFLTL